MKIKLLTKINHKEYQAIDKLYYELFKFNETTEISLNFENTNLFLKKFPKSEAIIVEKKTIIGEITTIPTNNKIMKEFLENKITEKELGDRVFKEVSLKNFNCIYLCYFALDKKYRGQGITKKGIEKILEYYLKINPKVKLFAWPLSEAGEKISKKISEEYSLPLFIKK